MSDEATPPSALLEPEELAPAVERCRRVLAELDRILLGREALHRRILIAVLSQGHVLLEGVPGVGKTALIKALGEVLCLDFRRVQFTPDLMPGDILGTHLLADAPDGSRRMIFHEGPVFTQILLADEINRASPKTQSALLEAMQERSVTLLGETRSLPRPFFVLASQNPVELEGTYPLPEAQLDRFLFKLEVEPPPVDVLEDIVRSRRRGEPPAPQWKMTAADLDRLFAVIDRIVLPRAVARYAARLVAATHPDGPEATEKIRTYVTVGASPRGAIGLGEAARARALLDGRPSAGFEDVDAVAGPALAHRLMLDYRARYEGISAAALVAELVSALDPAELGLPAEIEVG